MLTLNDFLFGILIPAVVAGSVLGIGWKVWERSASSQVNGKWSGAIAVAGAFLAGFFLLAGWPGFPPKFAEGWLPLIAVMAAAAGLIVARWPRVQLSTPFLLIFVMPRGGWSDGQSAFWIIAAILVGMPLIIEALEIVATKRPGASIPLALWIWAAGSAVALAATGSLKYGQFAGTLAAAMGAGVVIAWIYPRISFASGAASALYTLVGTLLMLGYFYSELPAIPALILAIAPLVLLIGETNIVTLRAPWLGATLRALLIAAPVAAAILIAVWPQLNAAKNPYGGY